MYLKLGENGNGPLCTITTFNDRRSTKHKDIVAFLNKVARSISTAKVNKYKFNL